ncbi:hypothetical protein MMC21_001007 [Puttea exsequens]|nr:hypothetical protein [Puttea exsequens]
MSTYRDPDSYASSRSPSQRGYPTEAPLSRSMSGPPVPGILPSSAYSGFAEEGREVARRRRRNIHQSRRQGKLLHRKALLPSISFAGPSEADYGSGTIDLLIAHSASSFDSHGAYTRTPSVSSSYIPGMSA